MNSGILYIVATPIGNLKDITGRALDVLRGVDCILCEDTRITAKLLNAYAIAAPTLSLHQHSSSIRFKEILNLLLSGKNLALVTDAGTPGISDPGNLLIDFLLKQHPKLKIIPIPGPSAIITALSVSGMPTDKFYFAGFPPLKNKRNKFFQELSLIETTIVLYESTHRVLKTLSDLKNNVGDERKIMVARELTKQFESIYRSTVKEISNLIEKDSVKGEFVIVLEGKKKKQFI